MWVLRTLANNLRFWFKKKICSNLIYIQDPSSKYTKNCSDFWSHLIISACVLYPEGIHLFSLVISIFYEIKPNLTLTCCKITRSLYILLKKVGILTFPNIRPIKILPIKMDYFFHSILKMLAFCFQEEPCILISYHSLCNR